MRISIIGISDTPSSQHQTFGSVEELTIDRRRKCDLVMVAVHGDKVTEGIAACCRLTAMGVKASLVLLDAPHGTTTKNVMGIQVLAASATAKEHTKALNEIFNSDRRKVLIEMYGPNITDILMDAPNFAAAKKAISARYRDPWNVVLAGAEMYFAVRYIEEYRREPIDCLLIDKITAIPVFLAAMYGVFLFSVTIGGYGQQEFVAAINQLIQDFSPPSDLTLLTHIYQAITGGVETVLSFVPLLLCMYLSLSFLEKSGYMARAMRMVDEMVSRIGLSGQAFVPLITGFGCNVPAITAASSSINDPRERIATIMMAPFMACGARLSVFILLSKVFFADHGYTIVFILYLIGIATALLTALIFKSKYAMRASYVHLPALCLPNPISIFKEAIKKTYAFVFGAGKMICMLFIFIYLINIYPSNNNESFSESSMLVKVSKSLTPIFSYMGVKEDNWPAVAAIATGTIAKESIVGTMKAIYGDEEAGAEQMRQLFDGKLGAFCYLLFVLLYFPCISVFATIAKQLNYRWALLSLLWSNFIAYFTATATYQIGSFFIAHNRVAALFFVLIMLISGVWTLYNINRDDHHASPKD